MAFFKKKPIENEYVKAQSQMNEEPVTKASERIFFDEITGDDQRTLYLIDRLELMRKVFLVIFFFLIILLFIYSIIKLNVFLIILSILLYFSLPFAVYPIVWMQLMLENLYEIKNNQSKK